MTRRRSDPWTAVALSLKAALVALVLLAVTHQQWHRFANKAMTARAVLYPLVALLVPVVWLAARRRFPYPGLVDALLVLPFVIDLAGNALDLYDRVSWFDDACHFGNWAILVSAIGVPVARRCGPWVTLGLCAGLGAAIAIVWEIGEYGAFILKTAESVTAYRDTVGDLALGLSGSVVAGLVAAARARRVP
jgi:hypothetical protein